MLQNLLGQLLPQPQRGLLFAVLATTALDWVAGILAALRSGTFSFGVLGAQFRTFVYFVGGLIVLQIGSMAFFGGGDASGATSLFVLAATAAIGQNTRDIAVKVGVLLGGSAPPAALTLTQRAALPVIAQTVAAQGLASGTSTTALPQ